MDCLREELIINFCGNCISAFCVLCNFSPKLDSTLTVKLARWYHLNNLILHIVAADKSIMDSPPCLVSVSHI